MTRQTLRSAPVSVVIRRAMNDHGAMTVETEETNEVRHLVDYGSDHVRSVLAALPAGATVPVRMTRVGSRSNAWRASGLPSGPFSSPASRPTQTGPVGEVRTEPDPDAG
jgi:hypothetical protein